MAQDGTAGGVNISGSQGVQAGTGNVQHNYYRESGLSFLTTWNPHKSVARLRGMPHDEAVSALASAPLGDVAEVLRVMLKADEALAVALLGDINPRKARELIGPLKDRAPWLEYLLVAAEMTSQLAAQVKWDRDADAEPLRHTRQASLGEDCFIRKYRKGMFCFGTRHGVFAIKGAIAEYYQAQGGPAGEYGFPVSNEIEIKSSSLTWGQVQYFDDGAIFSSIHGVFGVPGSILKRRGHAEEKGDWLGFPIAAAEDFHEVDPPRLPSEDQVTYPVGRMQWFEGGAVYAFLEGEAFSVRREVMEALLGDHQFRPVSEEVATESSSRTPGRVQRFLVNLEDGEQETAVFSFTQGHLVIAPQVWSYYRDLGGEDSWLGFPREAAVPVPAGAVSQFFQGGYISWRPETGPIAVTAAVWGVFFRDLPPDGMGYPVTEERIIGPGESDRIQFFNNCVVTLRDGKREIWPRLESSKPPLDPQAAKVAAGWQGSTRSLRGVEPLTGLRGLNGRS